MAADVSPLSEFPDGARVVFCGDSITRNNGAILRIAAHYRRVRPERTIRFRNCGISGGGVASAQMYFDVWIAPEAPTHVVLGHGVNNSYPLRLNDAADDPAAEAERVRQAAASFRERYAALVDRILATGASLILRTPTPYDESASGSVPIEKDEAGAHRRIADEIRAFAAERGLPLLDDMARMSRWQAAGEPIFTEDRVHLTDYGQWRLAETLLAAQGLDIGSYRPREEIAAESGLVEWDALSLRIADLFSTEWICIRDETLSLDAKLAKARQWLDVPGREDTPANRYITRITRDYLRDKPMESALRESLLRADIRCR